MRFLHAVSILSIVLLTLAGCCNRGDAPSAQQAAAPPDASPAATAPCASRAQLLKQRTIYTGLDVMEREGFKRLAGRKVGLIANHSALNRNGVHLLDLVIKHPEVQLVALFSPEHGFRGTEDEKVKSGIEETTGLPLYSLYGETHRPTDDMLKGIDTLVFDIQDIGARFYTYNATMGACMEEAAKRGIRFVVLDRPNPIGGHWFDGPIQDADLVGKFTSFLPMPVSHGLTLGELAQLYNTHYGIGVSLDVVQVEGWARDVYFDETGLPWVNPSPNMRSMDEEILYTMVALTESSATGISVGRGTDRPFEYFGAPWMDGEALARELRAKNLPGIWITPFKFMPYDRDITGRAFPKYPGVNQECGGIRIVVTDRWNFRPVESGIHLMSALYKLHPDKYKIDLTRGSVGATWVVEAIKAGEDPAAIAARWRESKEFKDYAAAREKVLLYGTLEK